MTDEQLAPPSRSGPEVFRERRRRLSELAEQRGIKRIALTSGWARPRNFAHNSYPFRPESHFLYLTGVTEEGAVLIFDEGEFRLYLLAKEPSDALWHGPPASPEELSLQSGLDCRPLSELPRLLGVAALPPQDDETALWLGDLLDRDIEAQSGPHLDEQDRALGDAMIRLRLTHDEAAITQLRYAATASALAHVTGMCRTPTATREAEVQGSILGTLFERELVPSYLPIVTTAGEILHARSSTGRLEGPGLLLADVGGETREGWTADITRTWPVSGVFSATQRAIYEVVLSVQMRAIAGVRAGVGFRDLHLDAVLDLARGLVSLGILRGSPESAMESGAVGVFFPHGLGHLLGLDVHDMEDLGERAGYAETRAEGTIYDTFLRLDRTLEPNMLVTIEPGFYQIPMLLERARADATLSSFIDFGVLEKFGDVRGIRIEDDVLVTESGSDVLSDLAPKRVGDVEAVLAAARDGDL